MLQLISLAAGYGPAAESTPALPRDAQAPQDSLGDLAFAALEPPPEAQPVPAPLPEWVESALQEAPGPDREEAVDPQQWLLAMLDQQAVQVQARGCSEARRPDAVPMPAAERLLSRLPLQAGVVVPGQDSFNPVEQRLPAAAAQPAHSKAATLLGLVSQASPTGTAGVTLSEGLPWTYPVTTPGSPLPGAVVPQEPVLERGLTLAAPQARWGEQMLHALRETVQVQVQQRFQQATIRLDPPELGSLEILITQEPGRLSVQISAAQGDVARLLQHTSDRLRQELLEQNTLQVEVQVSSDSQGHAGRDSSRQQHEPRIAEAIQDAPGAPSSNKHRASDVLVTV